MTDFERSTVEALGAIKGELVGIRDHLAKLNGKVALQELEIVKVKMETAERRNQCPLVDSLGDSLHSQLTAISDYIVAEKAKSSQRAKWLGAVKPAIWVVVTSVGWLLIQNKDGLIKFWKP